MDFTLRNMAAAVLWLFAIAAVTSSAAERKPICLMYLTGQVVLAQCHPLRGNLWLTRIVASTTSSPSTKVFSSL